MRRMHIDIETLGTQKMPVVTEIGAALRTDDGTGFHTFHEYIDIDTCVSLGAEVTHDTVKWHSHIGTKFKDKESCVNIRTALAGLSSFIDTHQPDEIWAKGPHFDIAILNLYYSAGEYCNPINFWKVRDLRTLLSLVDKPIHKEPDHNALNDCILQDSLMTYALHKLGA